MKDVVTSGHTSSTNDVLRGAALPDLTKTFVTQLSAAETRRFAANLANLEHFMNSATPFQLKFSQHLAARLAKLEGVEIKSFVGLMRECFVEARQGTAQRRNKMAVAMPSEDTMLALCVVLKYAAHEERIEQFIFAAEEICSQPSRDAAAKASLTGRVQSSYETFRRETSQEQIMLEQQTNLSRMSEEFLSKLTELPTKLPADVHLYEEKWWKETRALCRALVKSKDGEPCEQPLKKCVKELLKLDKQIGVEILRDISKMVGQVGNEARVASGREVADLFFTAAACLAGGKRFHSAELLTMQLNALQCNPHLDLSRPEMECLVKSAKCFGALANLFADIPPLSKEY